MPDAFRILVVDDEPAQRELVAGFLRKRGFDVAEVDGGRAALARFQSESFDLVLTDQRMDDLSGLDLLQSVRAMNPEVGVIVMTAYGTIETAVAAIQAGASDYLSKPLNLDTLLLTGRRPASRFSAMSNAFYDLSPVVTFNVGYSFTRDTLVGAVGSDSDVNRIGIDRRTSPRDTWGVSYELRRVRFSDTFVERGLEMFHVVHGRWTHAFSAGTRLELQAGPHLDGRRVRPEVFATLRHEGRRGDVSIGYSRELTTSLGEVGLVDVHRIAGGGTFRPVPRLSLTALPAVAYNRHDRRTIGEATVPVYTLDAETAVQAASRLTFVFSARLGRQDGALAGRSDTIFDRRFTAQAVVTLVKTARLPGEWPRVVEKEE